MSSFFFHFAAKMPELQNLGCCFCGFCLQDSGLGPCLKPLLVFSDKTTQVFQL